jgi:hypothetical protein
MLSSSLVMMEHEHKLSSAITDQKLMDPFLLQSPFVFLDVPDGIF